MLPYILVKTVGAGPAPQARSLLAAFVTSAILCEKLTRTLWKTCIRAFFSQCRADKTLWLYCASQRKIYFHLRALCFHIFCFFSTAKDGFLERLSLPSTLQFIVTEKRCLLAAVDRNIFLGIITALVNMFWTITAWQSGTSFHIKGSFLNNI